MTEHLTSKLHHLAEAALENHQEQDQSLMGGDAGLALFLCYLSKYPEYKHFSVKAEEVLHGIFDKGCYNDPSYARGAAGIFWLVVHLSRNGFIEYDYQDGLSDIRSYLLEASSQYMKYHNFDFLHGAGGILHAFLEDGETYKSEVSELARLIVSLGEVYEEGFIWTSYNLEEKTMMNERIELGLAHGLASVITLLIRANKILQSGEIDKRIKQSMDFLKKSRNKVPKLSVFPDEVFKSRKADKESRLAWCNGDLGIACVFQSEHQYADIALANELLANSTARVNFNQNAVFDAGVCHGTSGIAHLFNRAYAIHGKPEYFDAAGFWLNKTLELDYHPGGLAGYKSLQGVGNWVNDTGLLTGISGIGLSLLGFYSEDKSILNWDRSILVS